MLKMTYDIYKTVLEFLIEEKLELIDKLLIDISPLDPTIEKAWLQESKIRLEKYKNGTIKPISGDDVFAKIK